MSDAPAPTKRKKPAPRTIKLDDDDDDEVKVVAERKEVDLSSAKFAKVIKKPFVAPGITTPVALTMLPKPKTSGKGFIGVLKDKTRLSKLVESIKEMVPQTSLFFSSEGMSLQSFDLTKTCIVQARFKKNGFYPETFYCTEHCKAGVNMPYLETLLGMAQPDDNIEIYYDGLGDNVKFHFFSDGAARSTQVKMRLVTGLSGEFYKLPPAENLATIKLDSKAFNKIVSQLKKLKGDKVTIEVTPTNFCLIKHEDMSDVKIGFASDTGEDGVIDLQWTAGASMKKISEDFSIKFLTYYVRATDLSETVTIKFNKDQPLGIIYQFADDEGEVEFYLMSKVKTKADDDDEEEVVVHESVIEAEVEEGDDDDYY